MRALVDRHDAVTREATFNERLIAFARYWGFRPRACAPYRARTKGKDERGVAPESRITVRGWSALEAQRRPRLRPQRLAQPPHRPLDRAQADRQPFLARQVLSHDVGIAAMPAKPLR